jgi:hypothetical protein
MYSARLGLAAARRAVSASPIVLDGGYERKAVSTAEVISAYP